MNRLAATANIIPLGRHMPRARQAFEASACDKNKVVMIYCDTAMHRSGKRSEHAELIMRES